MDTLPERSSSQGAYGQGSGTCKLLQKLVHLPEAAFPKQVLRTASWKGPTDSMSRMAQPAGSINSLAEEVGVCDRINSELKTDNVGSVIPHLAVQIRIKNV